jgi:branched-chain amino acid transport system ATP-binding protein
LPILEVRNLSKSFGGLLALCDLNITVEEREIIGLIGPNGSGKTTFFNVVTGLLKHEKGSILFRGQDITGFRPHQVCQKGMVRTFQLVKPFIRMTAVENVMVGRSFGCIPSQSLKQAKVEAQDLLNYVGLGERGNAPTYALTLIDRKRLELARALATRPKLLLLDEIMAGLNPAEIETAIGLISQINGSGVTVVIVEHVMKALLRVSERIVVLDAGKKIAEGPAREIVQNKDVIEAYLGKDFRA